MKAFRELLRTAMPLVWGQLALAANTFVTQLALARQATTSLHASLPGSMLAVAWMSFFNATLGYAGTLIAQRHGAGRTDEARTLFRLSLALTFLACPLLLLGIPLARYTLGLFNTPPEVLAAPQPSSSSWDSPTASRRSWKSADSSSSRPSSPKAPPPPSRPRPSFSR